MNTETTLTLKDNVSKNLETIIKHVQNTKKEFQSLERGVDKAVSDMVGHIKKLDSSLGGVSHNLSVMSKHVIDSGMAMSAATKASGRLGQSFLAVGKGAVIASADVAQLTLRSSQAKYAADQTEKSFMGLAGAIKAAKSAAAGFSVPKFGGGGGHFGGGSGGGGHGGGAHSPMRAFAGGMLGAAGLSFGGPLAMLGTAVGGAGLAHAFGHNMVEQGSSYSSEIARMRMSGNFTEAQIKQAINQSKQMTHAMPMTSITENLQTIREMSGLAGSPAEGLKMAPMVKRASIILDAMSEHHGGLKDRQGKGVEMALVQMAEKTANVLDTKGEVDEKKFDRFLNNIVKTGIAEQGNADPKLLNQIVQYMRSSRYGLSDQMFPVLGAMGADFRRNAGPMLGSLNSTMVSNNKTAHAGMIRLGLAGSDGEILDQKKFQSNQFEWVTKDFKNAMLRKEGIDTKTWDAMKPEDKKNMVQHNAPGFQKNAMDLLNSFLIDESRIRKQIAANEKVKDSNTTLAIAMDTVDNKMKAAQKAWEDVGEAFAEVGGMTPVIQSLGLLANGLRSFGDGVRDFPKNMPQTAELLGKISNGLLGANGFFEVLGKTINGFMTLLTPGLERLSAVLTGKMSFFDFLRGQTTVGGNVSMPGTSKFINDVATPGLGGGGGGATTQGSNPGAIIGSPPHAPSIVQANNDFLKSVLNPPGSPTVSFMADYLKKPAKLKPGIPAAPDTPWFAVPPPGSGVTMPQNYKPSGPIGKQKKGGGMIAPPPPMNIPGVGDSMPDTLPPISGALQAPPPPITVNFHVSGNADEKVVKKAADHFGKVMANKSLLQTISTQGGNYGPHNVGDLP